MLQVMNMIYRVRAKLLILLLFFTGASFSGWAQNGSVGIGTRVPDTSAILHVSSPNKGLLIPSFHIADTTQKTPLIAPTPAEGLLAFNNGYVSGDNTSGNGFYYWTNARGGRWVYMMSYGSIPKIASDTISADNYITVTGGDSAVLKKVKLGLNLTTLTDSLFSQQYFRDSVTLLMRDSLVQIIRDSTTNWYYNNTVLHDSIYNTIHNRTDSLTGDPYILVSGGDSSVLNRVRLALDMQMVADSIVTTQIFHDSVTNIITNSILSDTTIQNNITSVVNNAIQNDTTIQQSIFNTVQNQSDSLTGDPYILVTGGDSSVLNRVRLALDMQQVADSLVRTQIFHDSVTSIGNYNILYDTTTQNNIMNVVNTYIQNDTTTQNNITNVMNTAIQNDTTIQNAITNVVNNSIQNDTTIQQSIFNTVQNQSDSLTGDPYILVTGGDSSVLNRVRLALDMQQIADSLVRTQIFHDSVTSIGNYNILYDTTTQNNIMNVVNTYIQNDTTTQNNITNVVNTAIQNDTTIQNAITNVVINSIQNDTTIQQSIFNTVQNQSDSLTGDPYILVTGGDSSVLNRVRLALDMQQIADSLVRTQIFHDSVTSIGNYNILYDTTTQNNIMNVVNTYIQNDTTTQNNITNVVNTAIQNDTTIQNAITNVVNNSIQNDTTIQQSIFNTVQNQSDSITGDQYITVTGGDSAVLNRVQVNLNTNVLRDTIRSANTQFAANIVVITDANYTVLANDYTVIVKGMTADRTLNLPDPAQNKGRILNISQMSNPYYLYFNYPVFYSDSDIHNYLYAAFGMTSATNYKIKIQSDGTQWYAISNE